MNPNLRLHHLWKHRFLTMIACFLGSTFAMAADVSPRTRELFDQGWRFERFGLQADGSRKPEPGGDPAWSIAVTASSEELVAGRVHPAKEAMDGDPATRWCASDGQSNQWLMLDLGKPEALKEISINWDFNHAWKEATIPFKFVIEGSTDAKEWNTMADHSQSENTNPAVSAVSGSPRYLRISTTANLGGQWASIREVKLTGADGKPISNEAKVNGESPSIANYPDDSWRRLDLPHDWGIEGPFRLELPSLTGKLPWRGTGWYRKHFSIPTNDLGKRVFVDFDGAMAYAKIWCNGQYVGTWPYGYSSFRMDLTPFLKFGGENVLAVRLDTETWDSRWYPGAGIYRHVWLVKTQPVHIAHWGTYITTPEVSDANAKVKLEVTVDNTTASSVKATVITEFFELDAKGVAGAKPVAKAERVLVEIHANGKAVVAQPTTISHPKRWDLATPNRYLARTRIGVGSREVDSYDTPFGIRTSEFTARNGFLLNGKRVPIQGVCNHHDLGALGAAFNERALERQLEIMKEMGCNAIRTSHNPPAPQLLELADRMGILIMDEAFDAWKSPKKPNDYNKIFEEWHVRDLEALVRRDRNHPSVFVWSIGNEVMEQRDAGLTKHLADIMRNLDPTRPVSNGYNDPNGGRDSGAALALDVMGVNYFFSEQERWDNDPRYKNMPTMGSETSSCLSSRGEYFFGTHESNWQISSYDRFKPGWGCDPDTQFQINAHFPHLLGEFVWTGFDYLGEPAPYITEDQSLLLNFRNDPEKRAALEKELSELSKTRPPARSSYFGIVDLAGFKKDRFYLYQSQWRHDLPMVHILPHWNWPERVGQATPVHLYTSGDEAELFINGKSLGRKKKVPGQDFRLVWDEVKYEPGTLTAAAYKNGNKWSTASVKTTGPAAAIAMEADRPVIKTDGRDLSFVTVRIADPEGITVPRSANQIEFSVSGPGEIVAVDNGDPISFEPFQASRRKAFNGLALVIVRAKPGETGKIRLTATSEGLKPGEISLNAP